MSADDLLDNPTGSQGRISAPLAAPRRLNDSEMRFLCADIVAYARGEGFGRVPGAPDELLQVIRTSAIDPSIPAEAVQIAGKMLRDRASNGNLRALRALAVLEGREDDVAEIDARAVTIDFRGNRRLEEVEAMLVEFADRGRTLMNATFFELAEMLTFGEQNNVSQRAISLARERLTEAAERGNATAIQLLAIVVPAQTTVLT
jgi:hypothetical protein